MAGPAAGSSTTIGALEALLAADPAVAGHEERLSWARDRWLRGLARLGRQISSNRVTVYWLRTPLVFGSLLVPILATGAANSTREPFWRWATVAVSLLVALCTAVDQVTRPAARWRLVRETRGAMETEGWAFLERSGRYAGLDDDRAFHRFFAAVEHLWADHEQAYLAQIAHTQDLAPRPTEPPDPKEPGPVPTPGP